MASLQLRRFLPGMVTVLVVVFATPAASGQTHPSDLSLGVSGVSMALGHGSTAHTQAPPGAAASSRHPQWVLDYEKKMWPGFLTGLPGYEDFVMPVGMFVYFEDPFIRTDLRVAYVYHDIPDSSTLRGGQVQLVAAQIRAALSERWQFLATKDGYSWVDSHITSEGEGWNDIAIGLKYALHSDPANHYLVSAGLKWEFKNGSTAAWQGGDSQEFNPFLSVAKAWDDWHFLGTLNGRIPTNPGAANASVTWHLHMDYELTETFRPLVEVHGIHWLSNADKLPLSTDYLDVGSLGASKASGRDFFSAGLGFRWQADDDVSVGLTWEFPLESSSSHLMKQRVTFNTVISF